MTMVFTTLLVVAFARVPGVDVHVDGQDQLLTSRLGAMFNRRRAEKGFFGSADWPQDGSICGYDDQFSSHPCSDCPNRATVWERYVGVTKDSQVYACGSQPSWSDGTLCAVGRDGTCAKCKSGYGSYWTKKAMTACGTEPVDWSDGHLCGLGTTCRNCKNKATYWTRKAFTACGSEKGDWVDGKLCGLATTCNNCQNKATYWTRKALTACGTEPKDWNDGTLCGIGTTCTNCKNGHSYWVSKLFTACGTEKWTDGTRCALGTTCDNCVNKSSYWTSKLFTACGSEPCWKRGTVCGTGTTCKECCTGNSAASCPWYQAGVCTCG